MSGKPLKTATLSGTGVRRTIIVAMLFCGVSASVPAFAQDVEALVRERVALELRKGLLQQRISVADLEHTVLTKERDNRDLEAERLEAEKKILKLRNELRTTFQIEILKATFGVGENYCDAAPAFKAKCRGQAPCELEITDKICKGPDPGRASQYVAKVEFACHLRGGPDERTSEAFVGSKAILVCH